MGSKDSFSSLENAYSRPRFGHTIFTRKVGHTDLVLVCDQGSLVGLCMQNYKSLCGAFTICSTLVNIRRQHLTLCEKLSQMC